MAEDRRLSSFLFAAVAAIEVIHTGTAIWQHRAPAVHDGFQYFTLQYFFLNNAIQSQEVAQWIPYMTQGTVATVWYGIQGSFLQNVLLFVPVLVRGADLLAIFHMGMLVDQLILLTGTWLLARRFFGPLSSFFIAISVVGSGVWLDQPYWNFRLYYALPLVLALGHRFLETGRWRWFFLAGNLLALQTIGNLPYWGDPVNDRPIGPRGLELGRSGRLVFPLSHDAAAKCAGVSEDKIRFFDRAYAVRSSQDLVPLMTDKSYVGDLLFVSSTEPPTGEGIEPWTGQQALSASDSRRLAHEVRQFDANNLVVAVPDAGPAGAFMSYADVWHPFWRATVNGKAVPVYRANQAYKAVRLEPGQNVLHFHFGSRLFFMLTVLFSANAAFWLGAVLWLAIRRR